MEGICWRPEHASKMQAQTYKGWMWKHSFFLFMGGITFSTSAATEHTSPATLTSIDLDKLDPATIKMLIDHLNDEMDDKDKSNFIAKLVAIIQIIYKILKTAARIR
jgi:hypothetical protein